MINWNEESIFGGTVIIIYINNVKTELLLGLLGLRLY